MKTLRILLAALLAVSPVASAFALDRVLPAPRIKDNGDVRLSDDLRIGRYQGGKFVSMPDSIEAASTVRMGGPDGAAPSMSGLGYQLFGRRYATGSSASGVNLSLLNVEGDNAAITGPNFANYFTVQGTMSDPAVKGGRQGIFSLLQQTAPTASDNLNRNYVAGAFNVTSYSGDGGFGLDPDDGTSPTRAKGGYFGVNPVAILACSAPGACATNVNNLSSGEVNIAAQAGTSLNYKSGIQIASLGSDQVQGRDTDAMLSMSNQAGAYGWKNAIDIGPQNGVFPLRQESTIIRARGGTVKAGIDFSGVSFVGPMLTGPSGSLIDNGSALQMTQGGSVLLALAGGASGQGALSLLGRNALSPYFSTGDDFVVRSTAGGTLDVNFPVVGTAGGGTISPPSGALGFVRIKVGGTFRKLPYYPD